MSRTFIIAEAGVNHNGSLDMAKQLIDAAAEANVDAVKFQTFQAAKLASPQATMAEYQKKVTGLEESQYEMLSRLELDVAAHRQLLEHCQKRGLQFLSTPFELESLNLLISLDLPILKISSGDINNLPLLLKSAKTGKQIILSTGMSSLAEVEMALWVLAFGYSQTIQEPSLQAFQEAYSTAAGQHALQEKVTLLHCTTEYPAPAEDINLKAMDTLHNAFGLPVGYSDHTSGITVPIAAAARGAVIIEKHFTLDKSLPGPDHKASLEPFELAEMVRAIRQVEKALGTNTKRITASELKNKEVARKSIIAKRDISKGEVFTEENLDIKRPGNGVSPVFYWELLGKPAEKDYKSDEAIKL